MSFYITLPSNSSMNVFKNNTVSNFTTALSSTINLDGSWVVALSKIIFHNSIEYDAGSIEIITPTYVKNDIKAKNMSKLSEIVDNMKNVLTSENFRIDEKASDIRFTPKDNVSFRLSGSLPHIFNVDPYINYTRFRPLVIHKTTKTISKIDTLYIYADFIEDQFVGDTKAKLLETVSVRGKADETISVEISNPNYVDISKSMLTTINIMIKDSLGDYIHFSNLSRVVLKLHFKPKNYE